MINDQTTIQKTGQYPIPEVLAWADAFRARSGRWPTVNSGPIAEAPGETWRTIQPELLESFQTLHGNATLPQLLARARDVIQTRDHPPLTVPEIVRWANAYRDRHGKWPRQISGPIPQAPGDTWRQVHDALRIGKYGLPGGTTLARVIGQERRARYARDLQPFTAHGILAWANAHHARTGNWPTFLSGPIPEAPNETWASVEHALRRPSRAQRAIIVIPVSHHESATPNWSPAARFDDLRDRFRRRRNYAAHPNPRIRTSSLIRSSFLTGTSHRMFTSRCPEYLTVFSFSRPAIYAVPITN